MKIIGSLEDNDRPGGSGRTASGAAATPARARALEEAGCAGAFSAEVNHDPFLRLMLAAEHTEKLRLMTGIAVAFARSPMTMAEVAHDLNAYSGGRFTLGLGSQVKAHVKWRFNMPWSAPAARMKEYIQALHAIWDAWYDGKPLEFRGAFYTHTLMTPRFAPEDVGFGRPKVCVAAVGPLMTKAAAEVADGVLCHAFTTARYMREVTVPAIEKTLAETGRARSDFELLYPPFVALVKDDAELEKAKVGLRRHIAFYASTPAYRGVLDLHGWGELQPALDAYVRADRWDAMGDLIDETMLRAFAIYGDAGQVAEGLAQFRGVVDGFNLNTSGMAPDEIAALTSRLSN